jgi:hypothetical protein
MKEYVLADPLLRRAARPLDADADPVAPPLEDGTRVLGLQRTTWRTIGVLLLLEPIVLIGFYAAIGEPSLPWTRERAAAPVESPAPVARERVAVPAVAAAPAPAPAGPRLRVEAERGGRIAIDLVAAPAQETVARLAAATRSEVSGAQIFAAGTVALTRSTVAASPREAWHAVFGNVANFAIACAGDGCRVRFISLIDDGVGRAAGVVPRPVEALVQGVAAPAPVAVPVEPLRPAVPPAAAPPTVAAPPSGDDPNASEN